MKITTKGHSENVSRDRDAMHAESENTNRENVTSHLHDSTNKKLNVLTSDSESPFYRKYLKFLRKFLFSESYDAELRVKIKGYTREPRHEENASEFHPYLRETFVFKNIHRYMVRCGKIYRQIWTASVTTNRF